MFNRVAVEIIYVYACSFVVSGGTEERSTAYNILYYY